MGAKIQCKIHDLNLVKYDHAYKTQKEHVEDLLRGGAQTLIMCEHPPVITRGRLTDERNILFSKEEMDARGVRVCAVDRGGDVTLHAPGQLVCYPILNLVHYGKDLRVYLRQLEQVAIDLLRSFDIVASRNPGQTGVWVKAKKIASIGIGVRKWVAYHGIAINVCTDLSLFSLIKPCGLDVHMTSMSEAKSASVRMEDVKRNIIGHFAHHFQLDIQGM